ncbi:MAG: hypothetical protein P4M15_04835 [Alphaproteobacteria bacterium]|nr:hypothetical protein [Alphaproteobacteria bacterium]
MKKARIPVPAPAPSFVSPPEEPHFLPAPLRAALPYFLLVVAVLAAYANIFDNVLLFDDDLLISLDTNLQGWNHIGDIFAGSTTSGAGIMGGFYRPLQILLYLIVTQLTGGGTFGFHILNLALHIANCGMMYRLGTKLGFKPWGVFLASLVWAVHPLHVEAITYMSGTADPLFVFFTLLAIVLLLPNITQAGIYKIVPLFLLGLISKETMSVFPLLVMVCLFFTEPKRLDWRSYIRTWPLWLITLVFVHWRSSNTSLDGPGTYARFYKLPSYVVLKSYSEHLSYRIYTFFATLPKYLELLVWPHGLHMERSFPIYMEIALPVVLGFLMCALATGWIAHKTIMQRKGLALSWGLLWFMAAHAPDSGIVYPMNSLFLEHWMYLPTVGLFLGIAETLATGLQPLPRARMALATLVLCFAAGLAAKTYAQNAIWHDPGSFYTNIFDYGEVSARARNNLGLYYSSQGRLDEGAAQLKEAIQISDTYAETRHNLALIYLRMPNQQAHIQDAIDNLNRALEIDPNFYRSCETLSQLYGALGDKEKADYYRERAEEILAGRK